jgi:hypothetical protein
MSKLHEINMSLNFFSDLPDLSIRTKARDNKRYYAAQPDAVISIQGCQQLNLNCSLNSRRYNIRNSGYI